MTDEAPESAFPAGEAAVARQEPWEVFRQEKEGDPMTHGGSVLAPDARAGPPLRARDVRPSPGERPPVGRAPRRRRGPGRSRTCSIRRSTARFKKPGGYVMRDKLADARARTGVAKGPLGPALTDR